MGIVVACSLSQMIESGQPPAVLVKRIGFGATSKRRVGLGVLGRQQHIAKE